jgi:hypothetical protein
MFENVSEILSLQTDLPTATTITATHGQTIFRHPTARVRPQVNHERVEQRIV